MPQEPDLSDQIIEAAMRLAAERGWHVIGLSDIAAAAAVSLADLYAAFPAKAAIVAGMIARTDRTVLAGTEASLADEPARERLFDLLMRRLDALGPYKDGLRAVMRDTPRDPLAALATAPHLMRAMGWMLEAAGIGITGLRGLVRINVVAALYLRTLRVWLTDESPDLSATMASLDRDLRRAAPLVFG